MAGFGVSIGDFVSTGILAWKVYRACKSASADFEEVAREVISLHAAVKELEDEAGREDSLLKKASASKRRELAQLIKNVQAVLSQLEKLVSKYQSLSTKHRRKWDILKFSTEGLNEIRSKIVFHTSAINLFLTSLSAESLGRIEKKLDEIVQEFKRGDRDASSVVHLDEDVPEADEQWNVLKQELVDDGFTKQDIETHKEWIKVRLRELIDSSNLDIAFQLGDDEGHLQVSSSETAPDAQHDPTSSNLIRRPSSIDQSRPIGVPQKQSRTDMWTPEEDTLLFRLRATGLHWEDISKQLKGRQPMTCSFRYQHCLGAHIQWDQEKKNTLAWLYKRFKPDMWSGIGDKLSVPWRAAEAMHWEMGDSELNVSAFDPESPFFSQKASNSRFDGPSFDEDLSLRRKRSSSSLATSIHSDITEYDTQGQMKKRTVTTTNTYTSTSGPEYIRISSSPTRPHGHSRRASSPAGTYRGAGFFNAPQSHDVQDTAALETDKAAANVPLPETDRNLRERLKIMSRHLSRALRLLNVSGISPRLLEVDEQSASQALPLDNTDSGIYAYDLDQSGHRGPKTTLDHNVVGRELLAMEARVNLLRIGPRLELREHVECTQYNQRSRTAFILQGGSKSST